MRFASCAFVFAACGTTPDSRPPTVEVISLEILAPTCGQVQCHSTSTNTKGWAFDTLEDSIISLREMDVKAHPDNNELTRVVFTTGGDIMPPDSPLAQDDKDLIRAWLDAGAMGL